MHLDDIRADTAGQSADFSKMTAVFVGRELPNTRRNYEDIIADDAEKQKSARKHGYCRKGLKTLWKKI